MNYDFRKPKYTLHQTLTDVCAIGAKMQRSKKKIGEQSDSSTDIFKVYFSKYVYIIQ